MAVFPAISDLLPLAPATVGIHCALVVARDPVQLASNMGVGSEYHESGIHDGLAIAKDFRKPKHSANFQKAREARIDDPDLNVHDRHLSTARYCFNKVGYECEIDRSLCRCEHVA